ncbi:MucR family transcriptional regulator [Streptomyces sp. NPDC059766]|uniref:MucR family transcriptional regulator n=1 Tax=Streptomyces sp. NPDC059766 TaxID=3346940 RepID=UPI0036676171
MSSPGTDGERTERAPSHPDFGRLIRDESTDTVICHVCARAFRSLGAHVRAHDMTASEYRQEFGLLRSRALSARSLSDEQSRTRLAAYRASETVRSRLAEGRAMARSGELARRRWDITTTRSEPDELRSMRRENLRTGRRTQLRTADERMAAALRAGGFTGIEQALRILYVDRHTGIEETGRILHIGKGRVRRLLVEHGIAVRPVGENSATGRRSRSQLNDRAAAERVGAHDIATWLRERAAEGVGLRELSTLTGRSVPWVVARIGARSSLVEPSDKGGNAGPPPLPVS